MLTATLPISGAMVTVEARETHRLAVHPEGGVTVVLIAQRPDVETRGLIRALSVVPPPRHTGPDTVAALRRDWQLAVKAFSNRDRVADVIERQVPGPQGQEVTIRAYVPTKDPHDLPVLLYIHGGGFVFGDLYTAGATARGLARRSGAIVVAVRYGLAPEHSLEEGRADCLAAVDWLTEHADELGGDRTRVAIGGDSAGGGISALIAQAYRDRGDHLSAQLLLYPSTALDNNHAEHDASIGLLTPERVDWIRAQIEMVSDPRDPSHSALYTEDLDGLAPTILLTCGFDPLRDEGLAYGERLREAGVTVHSLHYPAAIHGFIALDRVLSSAGDALDRMSACLVQAFEGRLTDAFEDDLPGRRVTRPPWLHPGQRIREAQVGTIVARERLGQLAAMVRREGAAETET